MNIVRNTENPNLNSVDRAFEEDAGLGGVDLGNTFRQVFSSILKYWWLIALIFILFLFLASFYSQRIEPMYRSTATIEIKQEVTKILDQEDVNGVELNEEFMLTQMILLESSKIINGVVADLGLHKNASFIGEQGTRDERIQRASNKISRRLAVSRIGRSRIISISIEDELPVRAATIANKFAENFSKYDQDRKYDSTAYARKFVRERLANTRAELENSEKELHNYIQEFGIVRENINGSGNSGSLDEATLQTLNQALLSAKLKRVEAENELRTAQESDLIIQTQNNEALKNLSKIKLNLEVEYQRKLLTLKPKHPEMLAIEAQINTLKSQESREKQGILAALESDIANARRTEAQHSSSISKLQEDRIQNQSSGFNFNILQREVETNQAQYDALLQRFKEITISDGTGSDLISLVDKAKPAKKPFKPNLTLLLSIASVLSLMSSGLFIIIMSALDDKVKTIDDFQEKLGLYSIGAIPVVDLGDKKTFVDEINDPLSMLSESYTALVSTILQFKKDDTSIALQMTSTRPNEGKSSSSLALSNSFAQAGFRVLLIDADLRKPGFTFGKDKILDGLSNLISTDANLVSKLGGLESFNDVKILTAGKIPANPASLLMSPKFKAIIAEAKANFDVVIVDSPPVLALADAPIISGAVDGTILIVEQGVLRTPHVKNSVKRLQSSNANILGGLLTKYKSNRATGYGSYYYYYNQGYGNKPKDNKKSELFSKKTKVKEKIKLSETLGKRNE